MKKKQWLFIPEKPFMKFCNWLYIFVIFLSVVFFHCKKNKAQITPPKANRPIVTEGGKYIEFPETSEHPNLFKTYTLQILELDLNLKFPASVIGKVKKGKVNGQPLILFSSPELTGTYSKYIQNLTLIQIAKTNFNRTKDLYDHGAATGKELNDASAELFNTQSTLAESESTLMRDGFNPAQLRKAKPGTTWLISDLPESEINILQEGISCILEFSGFPSEEFPGKIEAIADVLNTQTRKARIRVVMIDHKDQIRPGMYGTVKFKVGEKGLMIPKEAVVTFNAKTYVFLKESERIFRRQEITLSTETDIYYEISSGLKIGDEVVISNSMLLKGISFGI
jgi:hypothetical protein